MKKTILILFILNALTSLAQERKNEGITSPLHQKYLSKIVFAPDAQSLDKQKEVESNFKTEFNLGDPIHFRAYFDNSLTNYVNKLSKNQSDINLEKRTTYLLKFYIDNKYVENLTEERVPRNQFTLDEKHSRTTFRGALKSVNNAIYIGLYAFNEILIKHESTLSSGKHQLKLEILPTYDSPNDGFLIGDIIASGEITLNVKGSVIDPNDTRMCMPIDKMKDELLTKQIAKDYLKNFQITADDVRILTTTWEIQRNKYTSVIEKRTIDVAIGYKDPKTGVCNKQNYLASQEYVGGKFLDEFSFYGNMQNLPQEISCKCLQTPKLNEVKKEPVKTTTQPKKVK